MKTTVAECLVEGLVKANVKHLYAVAGDSLNHVNEAIRVCKDIRWIHVRHEESGAFAAEAESMLNGIGCCAGSSGPGHVHLINGLYDANHSKTPLIVIASTCGSCEFGTDFFQETNTTRLFDDCSCYNQVASTPAQFARMFPAAISSAIAHQQVAVVALPGDVAAQPAAEPVSNVISPRATESTPAAEVIEQLAKLIDCSERIALFCGIGAAQSLPKVVALAERLKAPVVSTFRGKLALESDNPYYVGLTGLLGTPAAYVALQEADLIIMLGTDFPYTNFIPSHAKIAQVDIRADHLGRRAAIDVAVVGDVGRTITQLIDRIKPRTEERYLENCLKLSAKVSEDLLALAEHKGSNDKIAPEYLASLINRYASSNAVFTVDTGMCCTWAARYLHVAKSRTMLASFNHGSMCNALPMAIGAALAQPERQVVAMCGDGGLSMMLGELATVVQYDLPLKIVVFNNHALGMVKLEMELEGLVDNQTDMLNPNFADVAKSMGMNSITVTNPDEVESALSACFDYRGPMLVDVHTDANALAIPPKITWDQIRGFSMSMTRMLEQGKAQEFVDIIKSNLKLVF